MTAFSRNASLIIKTFLYQIVMSLFGFMMYGSTYKIPFLLVVGQATVILFYYYILGSQMVQGGGKMCEYDMSHGTKSSPLFGFLLAFMAFLPTIILAVISVIAPPYVGGATNTAGYLSYLGNHTFLQGMYVGITQHLYPTSSGTAAEALAQANALAVNSRCYLHLFGAVPGILLSGFSYLFGYLNFKKDKK